MANTFANGDKCISFSAVFCPKMCKCRHLHMAPHRSASFPAQVISLKIHHVYLFVEFIDRLLYPQNLLNEQLRINISPHGSEV